MEKKLKLGEVKVEKCFHFFTIGGGQFSLKQKEKDENRNMSTFYFVVVRFC